MTDDIKTIDESTPLSVVDDIGHDLIADLAESSYGMGNRWVIDWERFYQMLESNGWDMQDLGGRVDEKIRRIGRAAVKDGGW